MLLQLIFRKLNGDPKECAFILVDGSIYIQAGGQYYTKYALKICIEKYVKI